MGAIIDADASIISRSFLDEALTNYATSTALDLKADKADLTTLSEIVGTPAEMTYDYVVERAMRDLFGNSYDASGVFPTRATRFKTHQTVRFSLDFPALLSLAPIVILLRSGQFLFLLGHAIPTKSRPRC